MIGLGLLMTWKGYGRKWSWPLSYYPGACLEGLRKTKKESHFRITDFWAGFEPRPSEYEAGVLTIRT
jgi:hypothetical protein